MTSSLPIKYLIKRYVDSLADEFFLGSINCPDEADPWEITLKLNNTAVKFKIDTGADITVISESTYLAFPSRPQLMPANSTLNSPGGKIKGRFLAHTVTKDRHIIFACSLWQETK